MWCFNWVIDEWDKYHQKKTKFLDLNLTITSGCFHFNLIIHTSFVSEKWMKEFHVTEMCQDQRNSSSFCYEMVISCFICETLGCCWLLMFFPGACQHCSFHRGVQLLSLCLGVNREFRWKFCGIISLAFPWRNSVAASPGWHLVEGGCCVLGVFWKVLTRVFHLKMKWGRVDA